MEELLNQYAANLGGEEYAFTFENLKKFEASVTQSEEHQVGYVAADEDIAAYIVDAPDGEYVIRKGEKGVMKGSVSFEVLEAGGESDEIDELLTPGSNAFDSAAKRTGQHPMIDPTPSGQNIRNGKGEVSYTNWEWSNSAQDSGRL